MGRIHKLLIWSCLRGIAIGWTILGLGFALNVFNMREIVFTSSSAVMATLLLMMGFGITFGNASMGHAVMSMPRKYKE